MNADELINSVKLGKVLRNIIFLFFNIIAEPNVKKPKGMQMSNINAINKE